jgi:hypothetical protein
MSSIAMCKRNGVEPFAWFCDVLTRMATHPINRIEELLPHNWKAIASAT